MSFLDVGDRTTACIYGLQEILHVAARGWGGIQFDVLFGDIFRILLALIYAIEVNRFLLFVLWDEICAHGAGFKRSFIAVNEQSPRIVRVGRCAPGAMLPNGIEAIEFEG